MKNFTVLIALVLLLFQTIVFSWSGHEAYTYLVISSTNIDKERLVTVTPYSYKETRVYNSEYYYKEDFAGKRKFFDDLGDGIFPPDPIPTNGKLPVWQILTIYAQFPDFGMDEGLNLSLLQALIGNSQGVRHMRYKLGIIEAFEGDKSFLYFVEMSKQAFAKNDEYWGYRFLSYALHYMQDLFQPYHECPGTFWEVLTGLFDKTTMKMLNNAHYTYDNYLLYLMFYSKHKEEIRKIIQQTPERFISNNYEQLVNEIMMYGYSKFPQVHSEMKKAFGEVLYNRIPQMGDFKDLEEAGKLEGLYTVTKEIVNTMTSTIKGFLTEYLKKYQK
ncbi:MAG: hypothetical protein N2Z58_00945 [Fervidobacterium sp.]|nr:hypothetical protein [Fervidobacterium sp.]